MYKICISFTDKDGCFEVPQLITIWLLRMKLLKVELPECWSNSDITGPLYYLSGRRRSHAALVMFEMLIEEYVQDCSVGFLVKVGYIELAGRCYWFNFLVMHHFAKIPI